ncbi:DUF547 domain-containing protein [Colwellia sp. MB02u-18]|uniref:DUF547 domain-containing protein n=1 Tax=unclassified Colwellia TaxID=196834 RepID=UPI0015F60002|nr:MULTISPECIES: DUF547 domain-containing protein [unclassified Colwellia]MBA6223214.1 DUF547 domain-containing protein [Colwellia sp. MB3u-45]MBA6266681.1 DUF547 domain-containing protein [Colwellia sp. MB3u-43]MBA6320614.1 DUF547 domain-containing protein [Colwellia sp. MB02u-19]MBA6323867.1 DUF547 domain-containing protein [Colwellia sp. MB02u-18]MBA6329713.1 DUF547 domain-containing protein [Colwellia sp. MB02u-12]
MINLNKALSRAKSLPLAVLLLLSTVFSAVSTAQEILHQPWQALLTQHVSPINDGHSSQVNYAGMKTDHVKLTAYLTALGKIDKQTFEQWPAPKQLSFLINAYNAWTVELILTAYPDIKSIKDLGSFFSSPWSKKFIPLLGETRSLDNIEHELIRGDNKYADPRIHFAVNCASIGCPALREEAYSADKLEQQLTEQTIRFLTDKSRNRFTEDAMELSAIFKWYGDDFTQGFRGSNSLSAFVLLYRKALNLTPAQQAGLKSEDMATNFLTYDWALNAVR